MALLQDQQARLKRHHETRRRKKRATATVWDSALLVFLIVIGLMVLIAMIVRIPNLLPGQRQGTGEGELLSRLNELVSHEREVVIPKTLGDLQQEVAAGDFSLFATPKIKTSRVNAPTDFTVYILRGEGFTDPIRLSVSNLPAKASAVSAPEIATEEKYTTITIQMPSNAIHGNYEIAFTGTSGERQRSTIATVVVTELLVQEIALIETRPMDQGGKWQATLGWKTSALSNSRVDYTSQDHFVTQGHSYAFTKTSDENVDNHSLTLYDLEPLTFYYYRILSADSRNNVVVSKDQLFLTSRPEDLAFPLDTPI